MESNMKEMVYRHLVVEGTPYNIGRMEGEFIKKYHQSELELYTKGHGFIKPASEAKVEKTMKLFDRYCPYLNEEIKGFADSLGVSPKDIIYYSFSGGGSSNCSHFAVLPNKTSDKHFYVGRSYEWNTEDELRLITTKMDGLNASFGFSLLLFGRFDGMNQHGLCVTMSNAVPCVVPEEEGLRFWVVIRLILDKCSTVDEAVELINELPISSYCNLIIADRYNNAVLAEISNSTKMYKRITSDTEASYLCSTNHYTLDGMQSFVRNRMKQSLDRYNSVVRVLDREGKIEKEELKGILSRHYPEGLACHYYEDVLGTLWSILFDVTKAEADICFGSPVLNKWHTFNFDSSPEVTEYKVLFTFKNSNPDMWKKI